MLIIIDYHLLTIYYAPGSLHKLLSSFSTITKESSLSLFHTAVTTSTHVARGDSCLVRHPSHEFYVSLNSLNPAQHQQTSSLERMLRKMKRKRQTETAGTRCRKLTGHGGRLAAGVGIDGNSKVFSLRTGETW